MCIVTWMWNNLGSGCQGWVFKHRMS